MSKSRRRQSGGSLVGGAIGLVVLLSFLSSNSEGFSKALGALLGGTLFLGITAAAIWVAWRLWRRIGTPRARDLHKRFEAVRSMSGTDSEVFMADLFRALGHKAVLMGGAGDQGVDIVVVAVANAWPCSARTTRRPWATVPCRRSTPGRVTTDAWRPAWWRLPATPGGSHSWPGARASRFTTGTRYGGG